MLRVSWEAFLQQFNINNAKSKALNVNCGKLVQSQITTVFGLIESISPDEEIKYLGATFNKMLVFNSNEILKKLQTNLDTL